MLYFTKLTKYFFGTEMLNHQLEQRNKYFFEQIGEIKRNLEKIVQVFISVSFVHQQNISLVQLRITISRLKNNRINQS